MSIFVEAHEQVRQVNELGNHSFYPVGYPDYMSLDHECNMLAATGRLAIVDSVFIRNGMKSLRNQNLSRAEFQTLATQLHSRLVHKAIQEGLHPDTAKVGVSIRAGDAFSGLIQRMMPGLTYGFATQTRDETDPTRTVNVFEKLFRYDGLKAYLFDPMLATGGSATEVTDAVMDRGAIGVVIVSSFATPEGVVRMSQHSAVEKIITLPLEAGLNSNGFIVGGIGETAILGDFGNRYFGPTSETE